jgi:putative effector of murein hydrolase
MHKITLKDKLAVYEKLEQLKSKLKSLIYALSAGYVLHIALKWCLSLVNAQEMQLNTLDYLFLSSSFVLPFALGFAQLLTLAANAAHWR